MYLGECNVGFIGESCELGLRASANQTYGRFTNPYLNIVVLTFLLLFYYSGF